MQCLNPGSFSTKNNLNFPHNYFDISKITPMFAVLNTYKSRECSDGSLHSVRRMRVIFLPATVNVEQYTVSVYPRVERQCAHSIREIVLSNGTGIDTFLLIPVSLCSMNLKTSRLLLLSAALRRAVATTAPPLRLINSLLTTFPRTIRVPELSQTRIPTPVPCKALGRSREGNRQFHPLSVRTNGTEAWHQACQPQEPEVAAVGTDSALPVHVLCDDPYAWFSQRGQRLHSCSIGILPSPRSNGVCYTGTFNIDGFIYTVGSPSIDGLYYEAMAKRCRHLQGIRGRQQRKKQRCALRYIERYPGAELPVWLAASEN